MSIAFASEQLESRYPAGGLGFARLGEALHRERRTDDALRVLSEGTRRHPDYAPGLLILGRIYFETGGLVEAKTELEKILAVDTRCPAALNLLAQIAEGLHAHGESARFYSQLAALEPWDSEFVENHRSALERSGGGTLSTATQESAGFVEVNLNDVANFLPQGDDTGSGIEAGSATVSVEKTRMFEPRPEATSIYSPPEDKTADHTDTALVDKDRVEGADIEKRLDDLFSAETAKPDGDGPGTATVESVVLGDAGHTAGEPMVTGEDIENQLDKLFSQAGAATGPSWEDAPAPVKTAAPAPSAEATFFPGLDERTIAMPAFSPSNLADSLPNPEPVDFPIPPLPAEEVVEAADAGSATETGAFEAAEVQGDSDTVVGDDIGLRLDELFGSDTGPARPVSAVEEDDPGTSETLAYLAPASATTFADKDAGSTVSGDDIENRLSEMFDTEPVAKESKAPASFNEEGSRTLGLSRASIFGEEAPSEALDEDLFPVAASAELKMEEESPEESGTVETPPNVATVTLAEIYFDQGLKEQALQIYRQLLEREPGNGTVKKRIEEIEASKAAEARGAGPSGEGGPLSPRPGLKVPRRKK